jgi:tRNA dimethylallyltransferase
MGPTASGKTDLAVELVQEFPFDIVSVDSAMVYRGMDIGTDKPGPELLSRAPHRLIDIVEPADAYSAGRFRADARREIEDIHRRGRTPLLVGGTMLYFRALQAGLDELPSASPEIRARISAEATALGWPALHERLKSCDALAAQRINPNDAQRIQRALEIIEITGRTPSQIRAQQAAVITGWRIVKLVLAPASRALLHERLATRFRAMMARGFLEEVAGLRARGDLNPAMPSMRAVGYRQLWQYLEQGGSQSEAVDRGIYASRQLARRQLIWLRRESDVTWFDSESTSMPAKVVSSLADAGLNLRKTGGSMGGL